MLFRFGTVKLLYISSVERMGFEKGRTEGRQEEARSLILRQLNRRVGELPDSLRSQIEALSIRVCRI